MNPIRWATETVRRHGLLHTAKVGFSNLVDLSFDLRHGTDTLGWKNLQELELDSENKVNGVRYQASKAAPLSRLLSAFNIPTHGTFVDFGSGKGRVLLLAAHNGFSRVVGVEFSGELCAIARKNLAAVAQKLKGRIEIEIVEADAARFPIGPDQTVFYFYNPFNEVVMERVMANLSDSLARTPRKVWLIYNTPVHRDVVVGSGLFKAPVDFESQGNRFCVFEN